MHSGNIRSKCNMVICEGIFTPFCYIGFNMVIVLSNILKAQKGVLPERVSIRLPLMVKLVPLDNIGQSPCPTIMLDKPKRLSGDD